MLKKGQKVQQEFGSQIMEIVGFEPELVENVITQWEDETGSVITAKFIESELQVVTDAETTKSHR
ncbi:MAG: hypothetical protein EOO48_00365 [Flavobacterium sp.]|nr:MAG: hypothetical protein EOO48_00365 [Flavobacterium sp.]